MSNNFLVTNIAISLLNNVENHIRQVIVRLSKIWHDTFIIAARHYLTILIRVLLDVLNFLFENVEAHIEEQAFDLIISALVKRIGFIQIEVNCMGRILPELVVLVQIRESL